ncbi:MAG: SDR family oxidoreductase [Anaerolineae bacterium]|nr:SDR family oxidoreductase [Anaerolineae bacterium]
MRDPVLEAKPILERFKLTGRVALVTGAGQGIGRAFAHALGEAGAAVAVVDISPQHAEAVCNELKAKGIDAIYVVADVTLPQQVQMMMEAVVSRWGRLDIGVNNAGMGEWVDAETITPQQWDAMMNLNLRAVFFCAQAEAKVMLRQGYGKIINTASMSGRIVNMPQHQSHYNASKAAVLHLTRSLAAEWASRGVRVNSISPGYTLTPMLEKLIATPVGQQISSQWIAMTPMHRFCQVTDLQGAVVFLASEASDYITGADIVVDGGYSVW